MRFFATQDVFWLQRASAFIPTDTFIFGLILIELFSMIFNDVKEVCRNFIILFINGFLLG